MSSRRKRPAIQLTSLLDLLFIMIFVSLIQSQSLSIQDRELDESFEIIEDIEVHIDVNLPEDVNEILTPYQVHAIFHFYPVDKGTMSEGKFKMIGHYDPSIRKLELVGKRWLERPEGYDMVPLSGVLADSGSIFSGKIDFPGCEQFYLTRTQGEDLERIVGQWQGTYICSQGETGVSLTIK